MFTKMKISGSCGLVAGILWLGLPALAMAGSFIAPSYQPSVELDRYNIIWTSQSGNSGGSMPCVGGDIGLNVWVEEDELLFYIGRMGCRDENGSLLKMGRVRVSMDPNPFTENGAFTQTLKLKEGLVEIRAGEPGVNQAQLRLWVDVHRPVIHLEVKTAQPSTVDVTYENWRHERIELPNTEKNLHRGQCLINFDNYPGEVFVEPDEFRSEPDRVRFWHRMDESRNVFHRLVETQGLMPIKDRLIDPCRNLVFGGELLAHSEKAGEAGKRIPFVFKEETSGEYALTPFKGWRYQSAAEATRHRIDVVTHIDQTPTIESWHESLNEAVASVLGKNFNEARKKTQAWWDDFWSRSYIHINPGRDASDVGWRLARNYALFRYMLASGLGGREPIMFNGGVLTFDPIYAGKRFQGPGYTPDHRQWGGALTAQNQRCMYWPMLKSGDLDLLRPGFDYYRDGLQNARERTRHYWGHDGCTFTEQITIQWLPGGMVYGYAGEEFEGKTWRYRPEDTETGVCVNHAVNYIYESQLEWSWMILEYQRFTGADISEYLSLIEQSVIFYDEHYRMREKARSGQELTAEGKLHIKPTNTLERHPGGSNPTSVIAGLHQVLVRLMQITEDKEKRERWRGMLEILPEMPRGEVDGRTVLKPTTEHDSYSWHMPAMYPLYPYQLYQLDRPGIELMRDTFLHGITEKARMDHRAWIQGVVHFAHLGIVKEARELLIRKLGDGPYRFPAFWPPDIDHAPDHNWGGMAMIGLQEMLMQTGGDRILLLSAWPEDWEVHFKLHAPEKTTVEAHVRAGKVEKLNVSPDPREQDVVVYRPADDK
jgi:hypothetical protein